MKEIFTYITVLREKTVGRKKYLLRREVSKKLRTQYCIRDGKFAEIYKDSSRQFVEEYWEQYFPLLEKPCNPFICGDIVYETCGKSKEDYIIYQVVNVTKTKAYIRRIVVEYLSSTLLNRDVIVPKKDCFDGEEIIEKQIGIINRDRYLIKLEYGIQSANGGFRILKDDKIWVGFN